MRGIAPSGKPRGEPGGGKTAGKTIVFDPGGGFCQPVAPIGRAPGSARGRGGRLPWGISRLPRGPCPALERSHLGLRPWVPRVAQARRQRRGIRGPEGRRGPSLSRRPGGSSGGGRPSSRGSLPCREIPGGFASGAGNRGPAPTRGCGGRHINPGASGSCRCKLKGFDAVSTQRDHEVRSCPRSPVSPRASGMGILPVPWKNCGVPSHQRKRSSTGEGRNSGCAQWGSPGVSVD